MQLKDSALAEVKIEIAAYNEADYKTFQKGLRLIELSASIQNYMVKPGNELDKARVAKLVLSNAILKDRSIQFNYQKPFDVLLENATKENWWRLEHSTRTKWDYCFTGLQGCLGTRVLKSNGTGKITLD